MPLGDVFENAWDCDHCGAKGIGALKHKTCPVCGAAAPGSDKEYIADVTHPLVDYADVQLAKKDVDWTCRFCQTRNPGDKTECTQCGSARSEADQAVKAIDYGAAVPTAAPSTAAPGKSEIVYKPHPERRLIIGVILVAILGLIGFAAYELLHTTTVQGQVVGFAWTRVVNIDRYQTVQRAARYVPAGGRVLSQHQVIDHYNKTYRTEHVSKTCYRNNGNGSSSSYDCGYDQQVLVSSFPVYATEYLYNIDLWQPSRTVNAGAADHNPVTPPYTLADNGAQVIGAERVRDTTETYTVKFADMSGKKQYSLNTPQTEWDQYQTGNSYPLVINFKGDVVNDPLKPNSAPRTVTDTPASEPTAEATETPEAAAQLTDTPAQ